MDKIQNSLSLCTENDQRTWLAAACRAALAAGSLIRERYEQPHTITMKGAIDLVTETDVASEVAIAASLTEDTPGIPIMAEETAASHATVAERLWIVDPLDGTTNFAHGFPFFAVSIALLDRGKPVVGVVYAPLSDELFFAVSGCGARLNDRNISVTGTSRLIEALVGTGFPYQVEATLPTVMRQIQTVLSRVRDIRRAGAAALDLAHVACGRLDGFYEMNLQPWDTAAGWLLVQEAGGKVSTFSGAPFSPFAPDILASNGILHPQLLPLIR
ncbi:inositol monophosphatase family protein [Desulfobulbus sp.]|uniref:inositol monophosphatase family protein n=1 Tax=Desulfobulbus sp. TaxID=895 RepID=UPI00286EC9E4|nr:inositol monophosphatase family protein [Desulfobulbus sp.]